MHADLGWHLERLARRQRRAAWLMRSLRIEAKSTRISHWESRREALPRCDWFASQKRLFQPRMKHGWNTDKKGG